MSVTPLPHPRPNSDQQQPEPDPAPTSSWWKRVSAEDGWIGRRVDDVLAAITYGWSPAAAWIKAVLVMAGAVTGFIALAWLGGRMLGAFHALPWPIPAAKDPTGLLATIDQPVRHYLATHTAALPVSAITVYATWQAVGAVAFVLSYLRSAGARLTWFAWGLSTVAMVWTGTPASGRQVAAGIAVLAWAALSVLALRGLSLTPAAFVHVDVHNQAPPAPEVRAEIHLPKRATSAYKPHHPTQPPSFN